MPSPCQKMIPISSTGVNFAGKSLGQIQLYRFISDLTPVNDPTNAIFVETDSLPKEISRFISRGILKASLIYR